MPIQANRTDFRLPITTFSINWIVDWIAIDELSSIFRFFSIVCFQYNIHIILKVDFIYIVVNAH